MAQVTISCDQAIFTSVRGPMGEGYRIIAASRGLKSDEKRSITRCSPSHDALCVPEGETSDGDAIGSAFYVLPTGRLCVAFSFHAGGEHTGRGGQRVYTHNVVFAESEFARIAYNPFAVVRAMQSAGLETPQLTPGATLPTIELPIDPASSPSFKPNNISLLLSLGRCTVLRHLMECRTVALQLPRAWTEWCEALLLGIPGPMRAKFSFGAGLRFSVGRGHSIQVFSDTRKTAAARSSAQGMCFVDGGTSDAVPESAWFAFVDRHWSGGELNELRRRTSRPFADCSPESRERIGRLYSATDAIPQTDSAQIITHMTRALVELGQDVEREIRLELCDAAKRTLLDRMASARWTSVQPLWNPLLSLWRRGKEATELAFSIIAQALRSAAKDDPLSTAEAALDLTQNAPASPSDSSLEALFQEMLTKLASEITTLAEDAHPRLSQIVRRWEALRPTCPAVARLVEQCAALPQDSVRT